MQTITPLSWKWTAGFILPVQNSFSLSVGRSLHLRPRYKDIDTEHKHEEKALPELQNLFWSVSCTITARSSYDTHTPSFPLDQNALL